VEVTLYIPYNTKVMPITYLSLAGMSSGKINPESIINPMRKKTIPAAYPK